MKYLFFEVWVLLLLAFSLGWFSHWLLRGRLKPKDKSPAGKATTGIDHAAASPATPEINKNWKPAGFPDRPEIVDDLKRIKGIGPVIEQTLNEIGVYQFKQIAGWSHDNILWVEDFISFPGRVTREEWMTQAGTLQRGGCTEFSTRVDKGVVDYD